MTVFCRESKLRWLACEWILFTLDDIERLRAHSRHKQKSRINYREMIFCLHYRAHWLVGCYVMTDEKASWCKLEVIASPPVDMNFELIPHYCRSTWLEFWMRIFFNSFATLALSFRISLRKPSQGFWPLRRSRSHPPSSSSSQLDLRSRQREKSSWDASDWRHWDTQRASETETHCKIKSKNLQFSHQINFVYF